MKKVSVQISLLLIVLIPLSIFSQKLELYSGALYNQFYDCNDQNPHYKSNYSDNWGYSIGFAIDSLKFEWHTLRIAIQYDVYSGEMSASSGGLGYVRSVDVQIKKSLISLSIYPINVRKLIKKMQLSIGLTGSVLVSESFSGMYYEWTQIQGLSSGRIEDTFSSYSSTFTFGIQSLVNYRFRITEDLEIVPQYSFYFGLSRELTQKPEDMKSIRHYFSLGIRKRIR